MQYFKIKIIVLQYFFSGISQNSIIILQYIAIIAGTQLFFPYPWTTLHGLPLKLGVTQQDFSKKLQSECRLQSADLGIFKML